MRLGFIGTGRMGHPMARKLIEAGHDVRALARSQDKRAAFAAAVAGFLAKDVEVARDTAAVLGATLGPLDQAIALLTAAGGSPHAAT